MATKPNLTLGRDWNDRFLSRMAVLHTLLGHTTAFQPKSVVVLDTLIAILQHVAEGTYKPNNFFDAGKKPQVAFIDKPPTLNPQEEYALVTLDAITTRSAFVSVNAGSIVFEDPFWALLAAHAIAINASVALPLAEDNDDLWKKVPIVANAIQQDNYKPEKWLDLIQGFISKDSNPKFSLCTTNFEQLTALRKRGAQALTGAAPPLFYELFSTSDK